MNNIEEIKTQRFQFLYSVYQFTNGDESVIVNMWELGKRLEFDRQVTHKIVTYLQGEGLIRPLTLGGGIGITHFGIKQVEEAISHPKSPTQYFPPFSTINLISIGQMINSQIQQSGAASTQVITADSQIYNQIKQLLEDLKKNLDKLDLSTIYLKDIQADMQSIEAQLSSSKPKASVIKECLNSIKRILENVAGSTIAQTILMQIIPVLGNLK